MTTGKLKCDAKSSTSFDYASYASTFNIWKSIYPSDDIKKTIFFRTQNF